MISRKVDVKKLKGDKEVLQHHLDKKGNVIRRVNEEDAVIVLKKWAHRSLSGQAAGFAGGFRSFCGW